MSDVQIMVTKAELEAAARDASTTTQQDDFATIMIGRVSGDGLTPDGYLMMESLLVMDLVGDRNGFTGERMPLSGLPPVTYSIMARLVRGSLPEKFREALEAVEKEVQAEIAKGT